MRYEFRELIAGKVCALVFREGGDKASANSKRVSVRVTLMLPCSEDGYGLDDSVLFEDSAPKIFGGKLDDAWGELDGAVDMSYRSRTMTFWGTTYFEALRRAKDYADVEVCCLRQMLRLRDGRRPTEYELAEQALLPGCKSSSKYFEIWDHRNES